jgi:hypothetical protein
VVTAFALSPIQKVWHAPDCDEPELRAAQLEFAFWLEIPKLFSAYG